VSPKKDVALRADFPYIFKDLIDGGARWITVAPFLMFAGVAQW
jgi:hypothetical protein